MEKNRKLVICGKGGGISTVTWDDIQDKPEFATVATTGDYDDLTDKPTIPAAPVQSDWNEADNTSLAYIQNKPSIPAAQVNADWNAASGVAEILNKPTLATVATSGSYNDLTDKPTVTQEQADWNQTDNTQVDYIKNKPTIPVVPAMTTETLTFTLQGGTTVTLNVYVEPMPNYFYIQDISGSDNTLSISQPEPDAPDFDVFGSTDRVNWTNIGNTGDEITATIPANGKLYLKATTSGWSISGVWTYNKITASGNHNIGGNIMSLLNGDNFEGTTLNPSVTNNLQYLFNDDTTLVSAEELILPTNVVDGCYSYMFNGCTALTAAPVLPATTLAYGCYSGMFSYCSALTTAPALPATTLAENCYSSMFDGCTSLTASPVLPAATLTFGCYMSMFYGCSSLNTITTYAEGEAPDALMSWVDGVAATGDFYNLGNYEYYESGANGIPTGWTVHTSL